MVTPKQTLVLVVGVIVGAALIVVVIVPVGARLVQNASEIDVMVYNVVAAGVIEK